MAAKFGRSVVFPAGSRTGSSLYGGLSLARPALAARLASGEDSPSDLRACVRAAEWMMVSLIMCVCVCVFMSFRVRIAPSGDVHI